MPASAKRLTDPFLCFHPLQPPPPPPQGCARARSKVTATSRRVECSGERLDSDTDLLTMVLYHVPDKRVLATANLKSRECSTSDQFSSCVIDDRDSRSTRLRTLVLDMAEHELRHFGCNLTTFKTDGTTDIISWSIYASQMRTCAVP